MDTNSLDQFLSLISRFQSREQKEAISDCLKISQTALQNDPNSLLFLAFSNFFSSKFNHQQTPTKGEELKEFYLDPSAFQLFIQNFGNPALYHEISKVLASSYLESKETSNHENSNKPFRLLDIGVGDGLALIGTLSILKNEKNWNRDSNVDLIEPSSMLNSCMEKVSLKFKNSNFTFNPYSKTIQKFIEEFLDLQIESNKWDIVQTSFAIHNLSPSERHKIFRFLHSKISNKLTIIEFDVPIKQKTPFYSENQNEPTLDKEFAKYVFEQYEKGLNQFASCLKEKPSKEKCLKEDPSKAEPSKEEPSKEKCLKEEPSKEEPSKEEHSKEYHNIKLIIEGFLIPILLGYFNPNQKSATFEIPISEWKNELENAGFKKIELKKITEYWWADCWMIEAYP